MISLKVRPINFDGLPYIGKHPNFDSTYFVLGFGEMVSLFPLSEWTSS
ncbi:hypothetical protein [Ulvibacterium marinum]|nr:hypothetical protein [Ulvibacterium marinum]